MTERNAKQWAYNFSLAEITKPEKCSLKGQRVKEYNGVYAIVAGDSGREKEDAMTRLPFHDFLVGFNKKEEAEEQEGGDEEEQQQQRRQKQRW